jgi:hypothetical protein
VPHETLTLKELIRRLQRRQRERARAGLTATLECDPPVVVGRATVRIRARFFASAGVLATLAPVVRSDEAVDFEGAPMHHVGSEGGYVLTLPPGSLHTDTVYHLTVHPTAEAPAHAGVTLRTFSRRTAATVRSAVREIVDARQAPAAASSPRGRRPSRRRSG